MGQASGIIVKTPLGMHTSHIRAPVFKFSCPQLQIPANVQPGRHQVMAQYLGSCHLYGRLRFTFSSS